MENLKKILSRMNPSTRKVPSSFVHFNYVFVHIPKTAGIGVSLSLNGVWHGHTMLRQYEKMVKEKQFQEMFKFAFVRDPISRFISTANFITQGGRSGIGNADCVQLEHKYQITREGINEFVKKLNPDQLPSFHFTPQYEWLMRNDGQIGVDFIGRVEQIEKDYDFIANRLGLNGRQLVKRNDSHSEANADVVKFSRNDLNEESVNKLKHIYDRDYRLFDY